MTSTRDIDVFSRLVESVYTAASDPSHWQRFLIDLADTLNAKSGIIRVIDERNTAIRANIHHNLDPALQKAHREHYVKKDIFIDVLKTVPAGFIATSEQLFTRRELQHNEFFADYMRPQENYHVCGGLAVRNEDCVFKFAVQRHLASGPFGREDEAYMRRLVPHIQRAVNLGHLLSQTRQQADAAEHTLNALSVGILLLDSQHRIIHSNDKAGELLAQQCGLTTRAGHVAVAHAGDRKGFQNLLDTVQARISSAQPPAPEALLLKSQPGQPRILLVACPARKGALGFDGPWPDVETALLVSNLDDAGLVNRDILMSLYGLTSAEARLACALSQGHELADLSKHWHLSRETLRSHLKKVLAKTRTKRQSELIRLLTGKPWNMTASQPCSGSRSP
ncbi:helix-turn-helix transcriptional regulator [Natronospira bacteriovora]|uniref:Helix-turn-helix transcriptional regulator n=1 Tax=Natronospira bacteriovora TaxID=3069753 RepID=A0ABU0W3U0_9GAMM|nr:helix-turn-helix transcriptional regulator [Natronospira sp. AB-CW4]MDQ2068624.1 helix-turn-helix transcriptional regulator [Natronospira sp. AB-CW4]